MCRDDDGNVHAFHNVCRHHGSVLACGIGQKSCFICPYHVSILTLLSYGLIDDQMTNIDRDVSLLFYIIVSFCRDRFLFFFL